MRANFVRPLYQGDGDWVSVYLETSWGPKDAADRTVLRWRGARQELQAAGADEDTLEAVAEAVTERRSAPGCAVFARGGAVALAMSLPAAPAPWARLAPLPDVLPMLAQVDDDVRYLQVEARRDGGEIATAASSRGALQEPAGVQATEWPVHKVRTGGWAQKQHQRSAEEAWADNAKELASALTEADRQQRPRFIVIAGDVKARNLLLSHLPVAVRDRTVVIDREFTAGSQELASAAQSAISDQLATETGQHLDRWREMLSHSGAVEGVAGTVAALRDGVAAEVLLHPGFDAGQPARLRDRADRGGAARARHGGPPGGPDRRGRGPRGRLYRRRAVVPARAGHRARRAPADKPAEPGAGRRHRRHPARPGQRG